MIKLSHLRDVLAVAEFGSLRAAGRHLGIAQPAITRSIRDIEHELGVTLFERHAKGVRLTATGDVFIRRAKAVDAELRRAREEIDQLKGKTTGEVSIGMSTASVMALLGPVVTKFRKRFPDSVVKIEETLFQPIEAELASGRIDFYVGPLDPSFTSTQLDIEYLFENRRVVMGRIGHPLSGARSLKDLTGAQWVRPTLSTRNTEADFESAFTRLGLPEPQIVLHARSALITLMTVSHSDLLTILPLQWFNFAGAVNLIGPINVQDELDAPPMSIVRRKEMPLTPMAEYLCDLLRRSAMHYDARQKAAIISALAS